MLYQCGGPARLGMHESEPVEPAETEEGKGGHLSTRELYTRFALCSPEIKPPAVLLAQGPRVPR